MLEAPIITKIKENKKRIISASLGLLAVIIVLSIIFSGGSDNKDTTVEPSTSQESTQTPLWEEQPETAVSESETTQETAPAVQESTYVEPPVADTQEGTTFKTYIVAQGDSLTKIAKEIYGTAHYWTQIFDKNKASIKDPDMIRVGQKLLIPVREDGNLSWDKKLLVDAYIEVYKSYRKQEKLSQVYWMLLTGVKRIDPTLVTYYLAEVKKFDSAFAKGELSADSYPMDPLATKRLQ